MSTFVPLDLTPADLDKPPVSALERERRQRRNAERDHDRAERQARARVDKGIDWSSCVIPGCGRTLLREARGGVDRRDSTLDLPMCYNHAAVVWRTLVTHHATDPKFAEAVADVNERAARRERAEHEERKTSRLANVTQGDIYFIRLGELIKVGWTRDIRGRLKSYGASAELLVCYPASRDDETNLHRQLRPALAKGREWYVDGDVINHFIQEALAQYGTPPSLGSIWTEPKPIVAGKRAMRHR